jgi:hypothetical protein
MIDEVIPYIFNYCVKVMHPTPLVFLYFGLDFIASNVSIDKVQTCGQIGEGI